MGQERIATITFYWEWAAMIVAYLVGWHYQKFVYTVIGILVNALVMLIVFSPAWPCFKKHELVWRDPDLC